MGVVRRILPLLLAVAGFPLPVVDAAAACSAHMVVALAGFPPEAVSRPLYWTVEGDSGTSDVRVRIQLYGGDCSGNVVSVSYRTVPGSATPDDYVPAQGEATFTNSGAHSDSWDDHVKVIGEALPDSTGLETATVEIFNPKNGLAVASPSSVPVVMVDDDAPAPEAGMVPGDYPHFELLPNGGVPVFMDGQVAAPTEVTYTVSPDPAAPATPGQDYEARSSGTLTFAPGDHVELIPITVIDDGIKDPNERLKVSITGAAVVGGSQEVTFSIVELPQTEGPQSRLHHPRQGRRYSADSYRLREIHIFTRPPAGLQTIGARFALRRNMKNGTCAWLSGKRFRGGPCGEERWLVAGKFEAEFFYYRLRRSLRPSTGRIRTYTAFSRAQDSAGRFEVALVKGRNANTFEVRPPKPG
jgi:hypothetical protein